MRDVIVLLETDEGFIEKGKINVNRFHTSVRVADFQPPDLCEFKSGCSGADLTDKKIYGYPIQKIGRKFYVVTDNPSHARELANF